MFAPPFASIALVNVDTPEVTIIPEAKVAIPTNVDIPVTFKSVNVFGPFEIAVSIVDVVTASKDTMFFNSRAELNTSVSPMKIDPKVPIPDILTCLPPSNLSHQ